MAKYIPQSAFDHPEFKAELDNINKITNLIVCAETEEERHFIASAMLVDAVFDVLSKASELTARAPKREVKEWLDELDEMKRNSEE